MNNKQNFLKGIFKENPVFVLVLGLCPVLAVTTSVMNALGMGAAFLVVLLLSNLLISLFRKFIPDEVRIPAYIVIIASLVTIVDLMMQAYVPDLYESLGIFIPLIVVNCIVLGRAEAFANKNSVGSSIIDALGMGVGFTAAIVILSAVRELLGSGQLLGITIIPVEFMAPATIFIMAPGAFIAIGFLLGIINAIGDRRAAKKAALAEKQ